MSEYAWREELSANQTGFARISAFPGDGEARRAQGAQATRASVTPAGTVPGAKAPKLARKRRPLGRALALSGVVALAIGVALAAVPLSRVRAVVVSGSASLSDAEVLLWSGLNEKSSLIGLDESKLAAAIAMNPRLQSAEVRKRFPSTLLVTVKERDPLAIVYARDNAGRVSAHCVDAQGVIFAPASSVASADTLTVISGVEIRGLRYGMSVDERMLPLLASLEALRSAGGALLASVSEVRLVERAGFALEVLVYPVNYRVPVRMQAKFDEALFKSVLLVLDVVEARGLSPIIRELDFRNDTFVYRTKEAVSG